MRAHNDVRTDAPLCGLDFRGNGAERINEATNSPGAIMRLVTGGCQQRGKYSQIPGALTTCATLEGDRLRSVTSPPKAVLST
jgi:hypothetical protein